MPPPAFDPNLFVARWYCSLLYAEDMPKFAADALEAGYDGPALRELAGLRRPTLGDVGDLFQNSVEEIGDVTVKSEQQAWKFLSRIVASEIIHGDIAPLRGAEILGVYATSANYPPYLAEFMQLAEMPQWGEYAPSRRKLVADIMAQAHLLLANLPEKT